MDEQGTYTSWDEIDEEYETLELQYEAVQYNELAESSRRVDRFFFIGD